ncbi:hypothetical protein [Dinoroseobacter sp. S375]|uniref:hypothetical protein n=1 Tax=Dinoroseobacter sp. S375 TaxID=3415136 RepID=UPI003C7B3425
MKVKLLVARASAAGAQNVGDEIEVSSDEARRLIEAKQAAPVRSAAPQKAVKRSKAEKAVK